MSAVNPIVMTAGGTGGHMFPALAVAEVLKSRGHSLVLVTDDRGARYAGPFGDIDQYILPPADMARGRIRGLVNLARGIIIALRLYGRIKPAAVIGFGGYASLPALIAARLRRIPYCIHEQNAVLGRVNRLTAGAAAKVALSFSRTRRLSDKEKARSVFTGNPVRGEIAALKAVPYALSGPAGTFNILVLGGSQGAAVLGDILPQALAALPADVRNHLHVMQQCRPESLETVRTLYGAAGIAHDVAAFFDNVADLLSRAHLVIARAGASTLSEIAMTGRPAVLVPLPSAMDDHQTANALDFADAGAGWVFPQSEFTTEAVRDLVGELMVDEARLVNAALASRSLAHPDAAESLADLVDGIAGHGEAGSKKSRDGGGAADPVRSPRIMVEAA